MAPYKYPRHIEFRTSLPKGNTGKVLRKDLKEEEATKRANE
jgi:acyl-coenzyme A synthetase/AMP-(fatty) acid ligase